MNIFNKATDEINEENLKTLLENSEPEKKTIDYKQTIKIKTDGEKKEFLADISSFANASGGQIIYGIKEKKGIPTEIIGINCENPDGLVSQINNIVQTSIKPKIPGLYVHLINLENDNIVIFIEIPKSWISPHMVTFSGGQRFITRNSNGKYPMDVDELRLAFLRGDTLKVQINEFKIERISKIIANEAPLRIAKGPNIIFHLIPLDSFDSQRSYDMVGIYNHPGQLPPPQSSGWDRRMNLDGIVCYSKNRDENYAYSYVQLFRNGTIEAFKTIPIWKNDNDDKEYMSSTGLEKSIIEVFNEYISVIKSLGVKPPIYISFQMLNIRNLRMSYNGIHRPPDTPISEDAIATRDIIIESFDASLEEEFKYEFDRIWNAAGFIRSPNYDRKGKLKL